MCAGDLHGEFQVEKDDYLDTIRSCERELRLYKAIAAVHVSRELMEQCDTRRRLP